VALGDPYAQLYELKNRLGITDNVHDDDLTEKLAGASREVEDHTSRQFNDAGEVSARVYVPTSRCLAEVDDFHTIAGLIIETDESDTGSYDLTWATTDYQLEPLNGIVDGQIGWPFYDIKAVASKYFPFGRRAGLRVTAQWGWASVPDPVKDATLILAAESFKLREAPFGVAGFGEFGVVRVRDMPLVGRKLRKYVREPVLVG